MPTPNFALPLYTAGDTAALDTLLNGQSSALDAALLASEGRVAMTDAQRLALAAPRRKEGLEVYTTDTNREWFYDGSTWLSRENGMYLIRPTSVVNGTINSDGSSSITASSTTFSVNGVFTSRFRAYKVVAMLEGSGIGGFLRLRAGGTDDAAALYRMQVLRIAGATVTPSTTPTGVGFTFASVAATRHDMDMDIYEPAQAEATRMKQFIASWVSGTSVETDITSGIRDVATAYDGFSFVVSAGTGFAGRVSVYGLA